MLQNIPASTDVVLCQLSNSYQHFEGPNCLYFQAQEIGNIVTGNTESKA
jgi:hypothetical protein